MMMSSSPRIDWDDDSLVEVDHRPVLTDASGPVVGWRVTAVDVDGSTHRLGPPTAEWEVDEVTERFVDAPITVSVRHSIDRTWTVRILLTNPGQHRVHVDRLAIVLDFGTGWTGWAGCDGAEATLAVLSVDTPRILAFSLLQGEIHDAASEDESGGIELREIALEPGAQYVVRLRGDWYDTPAALARTRAGCVPGWDWWEIGAVVGLEHPDQALVRYEVTPEQLVLVPVEHDWATEIEGEVPSRIEVELAGPRGRVEVSVGFAPALGDLVTAYVDQAEGRWPVGRQGLRIDTAAEAVVLQRYCELAARGRIGHEDALDAIEGLVGRMSDQGSFAIALLTRQAMETGDGDLAGRASAAMASLPGDECRALVLFQLMAARQLAGLDPRDIAEVVAEPGADLAAQLSRAVEDPAVREQALTRLGVHWGLGLRGHRMAASDLVADAKLVAIAALLAELDPPQPQEWAVDFGELLERHHRRIRGELWSRLGPETAADALAWLLLAPESS